MNVCRIAILVVAYIFYSNAQCPVETLCQTIEARGVLLCNTVCLNIGFTEGYCDTSNWPPTFSCNCAGTRTVNAATIAALNLYMASLPAGCLAGCGLCGMTFNSFNFLTNQFTCACM